MEEKMLFSYGDGEYIEGDKKIKGQIILSEHKLYLRGRDGDLAATYIPLEKIVKVQKKFGGLVVFVRTSLTVSYTAVLKGGKYMKGLLRDIVAARGLKKRFLRDEWVDTTEII